MQVGLVVRCNQCTNSGVLVFNELCEPCRVEVEGQARACINGALCLLQLEDSAMEAEVHHFDEDGENEEGNSQEMADYELPPLADD